MTEEATSVEDTKKDLVSWAVSRYADPEVYDHVADTREEAVAWAMVEFAYKGTDEDPEEEGTEAFYIFRSERSRPTLSYGDYFVEDLIDRMSEDEAFFGDDGIPFDGPEWKEPLTELETAINKVISDWFDKHNGQEEFRCYHELEKFFYPEQKKEKQNADNS